MLTFDTVRQITAGSERVPGYDVINHRVFYEYDAQRGYQVPRIGEVAPLFAQVLDEAEAEALVSQGKLTVQGKSCMNCHTLRGNGAYYAPDLTKAWLDPGWIREDPGEYLMLAFLQDPTANARIFGTSRRMPDLNITDAEAGETAPSN